MATQPANKVADFEDFMPDGDSWPWDQLSQVHKRTSYEWWMDRDSLGFRDRYNRALEARRDVVEGWVYDRLEDPKGNRGSDLLLMFANKGLNPDKWAVMAPMPDSGSKELLAKVLQLSKKEAKREAVKELQTRGEVTESEG